MLQNQQSFLDIRPSHLTACRDCNAWLLLGTSSLALEKKMCKKGWDSHHPQPQATLSAPLGKVHQITLEINQLLELEEALELR